jgi:hypothetical protein
MPDFLLIFHSRGQGPSTTAILKASTDDEAKAKARAIATHDDRPVELWRDQRLLARYHAPDLSQE